MTNETHNARDLELDSIPGNIHFTRIKIRGREGKGEGKRKGFRIPFPFEERASRRGYRKLEEGGGDKEVVIGEKRIPVKGISTPVA